MPQRQPHTPGFGALRRPGSGTLSNAELRDTLEAIKREHFAVDADDSTDHFECSIVKEDGAPVAAYIAIDNAASDCCDIVLTSRNLRALAAFLQEHFPNVA